MKLLTMPGSCPPLKMRMSATMMASKMMMSAFVLSSYAFFVVGKMCVGCFLIMLCYLNQLKFFMALMLLCPVFAMMRSPMRTAKTARSIQMIASLLIWPLFFMDIH